MARNLKRSATVVFLTGGNLERIRRNQPASSDARVKVDIYIFYFQASDGGFYVKGFEVKAGCAPPSIQKNRRYTHSELNKMHEWWRQQ